jgi:hypothetical protein
VYDPEFIIGAIHCAPARPCTKTGKGHFGQAQTIEVVWACSSQNFANISEMEKAGLHTSAHTAHQAAEHTRMAGQSGTKADIHEIGLEIKITKSPVKVSPSKQPLCDHFGCNRACQSHLYNSDF